MQLMLEELRNRLGNFFHDERNTNPMAHIGLFSLDGRGDAEEIRCAHIEAIGGDYIRVRGRLIDRRDLREVQPINF